MVLYKRKPIAFVAPPANLSDNQEIFVMRGTNEIFADYERYLKRLDYLSQKKFVDGVNGKSNQTFFEALDSENKSTVAIENVFPEVLRDPILRKVQFSTVSRLDELVNNIFEEFKRDFFPGEEVVVILDDGEQLQGVIREKAKFPMIRGPKGEVQRAAFSRYFVRLHDTTEQEALVDDKHLRRDRKVFTKQNVRAFLRNSMQRESWIGAPWLVKEPLAIQYRLPMEIPPHLLQDAKTLATKQAALQASKKGRKIKVSPEEYQRLQQSEAARLQFLQEHGDLPSGLPMPPSAHVVVRAGRIPAPPPPPPIKYPIEDLDVAPKRNGVVRPELEFFPDEGTDSSKALRKSTNSRYTGMESLGMLLEIWNTLNVQCEVYVLDSFTFDDFCDAMKYRSEHTPCELLEEIHCAVMKLLVDEQGKVRLPKGALVEMVEDEEEEEPEEPQDESEVSTPVADVPARSTRSRLSHVEIAGEEPKPPGVDAEKQHRATEMLGDRKWIARLQARDFEDGGWQVILVGILYNLSLSPRFKARCEEVLAWLSPVDEAPTQETARLRFAIMPLKLRASALQMITMLSVASSPIKEFLENCSEDMTDVRKRKIEHQKAKRNAVEELQVVDRERKILLPDNMPTASPKQESMEPASTNGDIDMDDSIEVNGHNSSDPDDDAPSAVGRGLRRGGDRKRKREEEAARLAEEKARKAEIMKQQNKQTREFRRLIAEIEDLKKQIVLHESKIDECDADLREANVQRTKCLGKDRFCNRYYWFERNGQPFGGLPRSSTASYGYANARVWVQGPDDMERAGFIDRSDADRAAYQREFGLTPAERRHLEEGATVLQSAEEWGYYDSPHQLDHLISWLDERGDRERGLRKELVAWRDTIAKYMEAHKKFKDEEAARKLEAEEEMTSSARVHTRGKQAEEAQAGRERCLKWRNSMAVEELGHLHSVAPLRGRPKKVAVRGGHHRHHHPRGVAVPVNRSGRAVTRQ